MDEIKQGQWRATKAHRGTQFCISCKKPIAKGQTYYQIIDEDSEIIRLCTTCYNKPTYTGIDFGSEPSFTTTSSVVSANIPSIKHNPDRFNYGGPGSDLRD